MAITSTPYCGAPPEPDVLWSRWNLDPLLLAALLLGLGLYLAGLARARAPGQAARLPPWRAWAFASGWGTLTLALVSPLCALSVSLFAARVGQHMVLSLLAAPLLVLGRPGLVLGRLWPDLDLWPRGLSGLAKPVFAAPAFTLAIWFWHAPGPYAATFSSDLVYWLMHISIIGTALLAWTALLRPGQERALGALATGAVCTLQMTFLGALITLTPRLLYAPHALTPDAWGLSQARDQQLGGLIMWVPGCSVFLAVTLERLARVMSERPRPTALA